VVFISPSIGDKNLAAHIDVLLGQEPRNLALPELTPLVLLGQYAPDRDTGVEILEYNAFTASGLSVFLNPFVLKRAQRKVQPEDVLNLQFTSGEDFFSS
jgi:hypothetical protein